MHHGETKMQIALVQWWAQVWRELGAPAEEVLFHVPNGGARDPRGAAILKAMGLRRGLPDIFLALPIHPFAGMVLELKAPRGRLSIEQKRMCIILSAAGFKWCAPRDLETAQARIREFLAGKAIAG